MNHQALFLSKYAINSFRGFADSVFYDLQRKTHQFDKEEFQEELNQHNLNTLEQALLSFQKKHPYLPKDAINLSMNSELCIDINLSNYPLNDYFAIFSELQNIVHNFSKAKERNEPTSRVHLAKSQMNIVRTYNMGIDLLEKQRVITFRKKDHDLLMNLRNEKYLNEQNIPIPEFYELINDCKKKFQYAAQNTSLPESPNYKKIKEFLLDINERIVKNEIPILENNFCGIAESNDQDYEK